ncbi:MAG: cysteine--tRNA ligase [Candidatus Paceibacterota bacterium]
MFDNLFKSKKQKPIIAPTLRLYNTESNKLEIFESINENKVLMYSCGPTVYDYIHIGNLRAFFTADILKRTLMFDGYEVNHTMNLTDFGHLVSDGDEGEDKMTKGLKREGLPITLEAMRELSDQYIDAFFDDLNNMRILSPTTWTRASDYVKAQIRLIETLDQKGYVYETSDGVYFEVEKFPRYGCLGNIDLSKLKEGARVEVNKEKRHPADFAVWKKSELGWDSRWGKGFPGWHIECSAMALDTLGKELDIHTGGIDLIPTHHNAEIAQSECATGKKFVNYWVHSEFITIDNTKVSKSLGNTISLRHLYDRGFTGDDYRYWLLTAHYRSPINFSWDALKAAKQALYRLKRHVYEEYKQKAGKPSVGYLDKFTKHINNDLDTPNALALVWELVKDESLDNKTKCATLHEIDKVFEIGLSDNLEEGVRNLGVVSVEDISAEVRELVEKREAARVARNWLEADTLRDAIAIKGYIVEDTEHGPKITKEK